MIKMLNKITEVSVITYYLSVLGLIVFLYINPSIYQGKGMVSAFKIVNYEMILIFFVFITIAHFISTINKMDDSWKAALLYSLYTIILALITNIYIGKFARSQSGNDLFQFILAPIITQVIFISVVKIIVRILFGATYYCEIQYINKKAPSWKQFKKKGIDGYYSDLIHLHISYTHDFIEASCSSLYYPDFCYKRFSFDEDGYKTAYKWVIESAKTMHSNRISKVDFNNLEKSLYPNTYEWTNENIKSEPRQLNICLLYQEEK